MADVFQDLISRTINPAPGSPEYETQINEYDQDTRPQQYGGIIVCTAAATIAVAIRLYSQMKYLKTWAADDALIVLALIIVYAQAIASILSMVHGAGLHQVRVLLEDQHPPNALLNVYTNYWIVSVLWAPGVACIKLSILIVYRRIFLVNQQWFKVALWINAFYALALGIAATFVFIFQCSPVDYYWMRFIAYYGMDVPKGTCLPQVAHLVTPQILSTFSDLVILLLPLPIIWGLKMEQGRKVPLLLVFLLGLFTVGCGIARISVIFNVSNVADVTWHNIDTVTFTVVECGVGIVCACLPPSTPLYTAFIRRYSFFLSSQPSVTKATPIQKATFSRQRAPDGQGYTDLELQGLFPQTQNAQVWSGGSEKNKGRQTGTGDIVVEHTVEWSTSRRSQKSL